MPQETPQDPLDEMLNKFSELLEILNANKDKPMKELDPELENLLGDLESWHDRMKNLNEETLNRLNVKDTDIRDAIETQIENLPDQSKKTLKRISKLKKDFDKVKEEIETKKNIDKKHKDIYGEKNKTQGEVRKKKFDGLGRRKNWKPL